MDDETKRNPKAFVYYSNEQRNLIHATDPSAPSPRSLCLDVNVNDMAGIIAANWNALSSKEKQHYVALSEVKDWNVQPFYLHGCVTPRSEQYTRSKRDPRPKSDANARIHSSNSVQIPKKPRSAYIFFCLKNRQRIQDENESRVGVLPPL